MMLCRSLKMFMIPPNNLESKNSRSTQCLVNDSMSIHIGIPITPDPTMMVTIVNSDPHYWSITNPFVFTRANPGPKVKAKAKPPQ